MTALSDNRATDSRNLGAVYQIPVAASTTIYSGSLVMVNASGYAVPASALAGNHGVWGVAQAKYDNSSGSAGDVTARVQAGEYKFAGTTLTQANVGLIAYAEDDQTVDCLYGAGQPAVGPITEYVGASSAWVAVGPEFVGEGEAAGGTAAGVYTASADYSTTGQYLAVDVHTTADQIVLETTGGAAILGILQNAPGSGADAQVTMLGPCMAMAGTSGVSAGDKLAVEASTSKLITATAGAYVVGYALAAISADATGRVFILPGGHLSDVTGSALANTKVWIGSASNVAAEFALSGDVTMTAGGVVTIAADACGEAEVADSDGTSGLYVAKYALALYDFSTDGGGAPGAITLTDAVTIPDNAIIQLTQYEVLTTCTSAADTATIKLNLVTDGDLSTAIAINDGSNPWDAGLFSGHEGNGAFGTAATPKKTTGARLMQITSATQALTAGKIVFFCEYWVSQ